METRQIFNPLSSLSSNADGFKAEASLINNDVGVCPKCKKGMATATIAGGDTVFYCEADRVALPTPNPSA